MERGVREVHVTPLTAPVSVYRGGNYRCVIQVREVAGITRSLCRLFNRRGVLVILCFLSVSISDQSLEEKKHIL